MDKQRKVMDDINVQNVYAQLWELDRLKKDDRELKEAEKKK